MVKTPDRKFTSSELLINVVSFLYMCMYMYALNLFTEHSENTDKNKIFFCSFTSSILAKLSTWCFEHSGDISCSLHVSPSHTDESCAGRNTCMWIYVCIYATKILRFYFYVIKVAKFQGSN